MKFPVIENVRLADHADSAEQWEWIEMVPQMHAEQRPEGVNYSGFLHFRGEYRNQAGTITGWEHRMPVELLIPPEKVQDIEGLGVLAESLEVDLLDGRRLCIRGTLNVEGLTVQKSQLPVETDFIQTVSDQTVDALQQPELKPAEIVEKQTFKPEPSMEQRPVIQEASPETDAEAHWSSWLVKRNPDDHLQESYTIRMIVVREDQDLESWAESNGLPVRQLMHLNPLSDRQLKPGQTIRAC